MTNLTKKNPYKSKWEPALLEFLEAGASGFLKKAIPYLNDRLYDFSVESADSLSCFVDGNQEEYETSIKPVSGSLYTECTCPVGEECKHTLALALVLVWHARAAGHTLPEEVERAYAEAFRTLDQSDLEIRNVKLIIGPSAGAIQVASARAQPEDRWWETIAANGGWSQQKQIFQKVLNLRLPGVSFWHLENIANALKPVKNPIHRLRAMNEKVEEFQRGYSYNRAGRGVREPDPGLLAFLASPEAAALETKFDQEIAQADLIQWLHSAGGLREEQHRAERMEITWTPLPATDEFFALYFQLKVDAGQRGLLARKPGGILQISRDIEGGKRNFGRPRNKLISWIAESHCYSYNTYSEKEDTPEETLIQVSHIYQWVTAWGKYVRWHDGGAISLSPNTAELTLSEGDDENPRWVVKLASEGEGEGREIPFADAAIILDRPDDHDGSEDVLNYFIRNKDSLVRIETHGMSPVVLRAIRKLGAIPMKALAGTAAGSALFHVLSQGRERARLSRWTEEIPCRGEVELAIDEESDFIVSARARAKDADGPTFSWTPHSGWMVREGAQQRSDEGVQLEEDLVTNEVAKGTETDGEASAADDAAASDAEIAQADSAVPAPALEPVPAADPLEQVRPRLHSLPRREDVAQLELWLEAVTSCVSGLVVPDEDQSFKGHLNSSGLAAFLPLWFQRPAGVDYFGNSEFRKMVTVRSAPRISIEAEPSGMDWLKVSVSLEQEISETTFAEMSRVLAAGAEHFVRLPNGGIYRRVELEEYRDQLDQLNALGLTTSPGEQRLHALHLAGAPAGALSRLEAGDGAMTVLAEKSRQILRDFSGIPTAPVPAETGDFLRPYQRAGVNFLVWAANNFGGALLADDMGLGKTLQMLATVLSLRTGYSSAEGKAPGPTLVVCPASVAHNWQREAHRFAPGLRVLVLERGAARRKQLEQIENHDIVIMNFSLLRRDVETLSRIEWFAIVADEAQAIKNPNSESSRALKQLDARYRFAMTGTPIENRISDLYSIVEFALPGYLGPLDKLTSSTDPESAARACQLLRSRLRPVLTRRLKAEVAPELPERVETRIDCEMGSAQKKLYAAEVKRVRMMLDGMSESGVKGKQRIEMLAALMRLRQICCDPLLLGHPEIPSGKTEELLELVPSLLEAGHKVLVFSQFVKMLNHLEEQMNEKGIRPYKLTGATTNRQDLVDQFEKDAEPAVFLISLKAGGTGLNLVSASHVILFDPWWNPSVEAQAIDRTHRIGQDKTVVAYRLVTQGTIEERILELQEKKRALVRNILEEDSFNRTLTSEDFQYLLGG